MSHYTLIKTKITRQSALIAALKAMGFKESYIEISDTPLDLKGYRGDIRKQKAHVRIKGHGWGTSQNHVGGMSNDLGFEKQEDGSWVFHVSEYDVRAYGENWQKKFMNEYARAVVHEVCKEQRFFMEKEEEKEDGSIFIRLVSPF